MAQLRLAPDEGRARALSNQLWEQWLKAPDAKAQSLLDRAMARRESFDYAQAEDVLDDLVAYCPAYSEGWNQRAFVRFLRQNFDGSVADIDRALAITPEHLGAMTGKVLALIHLGRNDEAQVVLRQALRLNPWLSERALLTEPLGTEL